MINIPNNITHSKSALIYALAYCFERTSYYGIRTVIVLYMIGETLKMSNTEALSVYGWFMVFVGVSKVFGALLGDLIIGNKRTILIGGVLQALGCFILYNESLTSLYIGFGLIVLGSGLFTSNTIAQFGKQYFNKSKLLDAGFTSLFVAINFGSFLGVLVIGYLADLDFNYGFIAAGILIILATVFVFFTNDNQEVSLYNYKSITLNKKLLYIILAIIISAFFWMIYEITYFGVYTIQEKVFNGVDIIPKIYLSTGINTYFGIIIISILAFVWSYIYTNSFFKLFLGLVVSALSFIILLFIPETPNTLSLPIFIFSAFLLSFGEMLISPILYSIATRFSNPKYLATVLTLVTIPSILFYKVSGIIAENYVEIETTVIFISSIAILLVLGVLTYILSLVYKKDDRIYLTKEVEEFLS